MSAHYSDEELLEKFWARHEPTRRRETSLFCYRAWMLDNAQQLFKLMLDGLQARQARTTRKAK